jgi:transposase
MMGARTCAAESRADLEALVPADHLLRRVDRALDLAGVRAQLATCYSRIGRPSVDPELLLRLLLVGYLYGITSERRLVDEVRVNVAYRWFAALPFGARVPHHSTFSKNRHGRFGAGVFRAVFEAVVRRCIAAGLVAGDACSVDGSMIDADASPQRHREPAAGEDFGAAPYPPAAPPAKVSPTDPESAWASKGGIARFAYYTNYLVDNRRGVIVDVEATPARYSAEAAAARVMVLRTRAALGLAVTALGADRGYGNGPFFAWCVEHGVTAYAPVLDRTHQGNAPYGQFTIHAFAYDAAADEYVCPAGTRLRRVASTPTTQVHQYRAPASACRACALKPRCTRGQQRQLSVSWHDAAKQAAAALAGTPAYLDAGRARRTVEARFAELKRYVGLRRLRLRGLPRAAEQFLLAATAQNLKRLAVAQPP